MLKFSDDFVKKLLEKDKDCFNKFYLDTVDIFFRYLKWNYYISDEDAQDVLSWFYLKLWNGFWLYKSNTNFGAWVWTVFKNYIIDFFKKEKILSFSQITRSDSEEEFEDSLKSLDQDIINLMETQFSYEKIIKAINNLEEKYREVIYMKFVEEKSYEEIAEILSTSNDNVRKRLSRAIKMLKDLLIS